MIGRGFAGALAIVSALLTIAPSSAANRQPPGATTPGDAQVSRITNSGRRSTSEDAQDHAIIVQTNVRAGGAAPQVVLTGHRYRDIAMAPTG